jgi:hypothetical protein
MARITRPSRPGPTLRNAALCLAAFLARPALAQEPAKEAPKDPVVTVTLPAPGQAKATLTVNADDPGGPPTTFKVHVGSATQTFTRATPAAERKIAVPADPRTYLRLTVEKAGAPAENVLALIAPDSRPLLTPDACATWDLATTGASSAAICVDRQRFCPTASRATSDRKLTETQCGSGAAKFCVPDYRIDVEGENKQKLKASVEGTSGSWVLLRGPGKVRHLNLPSIGKCPGVLLESGSERVRLVIASGQRVLVRVSGTGQITAEEAPPIKQAGGAGSE